MKQDLIGRYDLYKDVVDYDRAIDLELGLDTSVNINSSSQDLYSDLSLEALQTSYLDYWQILSHNGRQKVLCDYGAGFCRGTLLANKMGFNCISLEISSKRVLQAQNAQGDSSNLLCINLFNRELIPKCDSYFLYIPEENLLDNFFSFIIHHKLNDVGVYVIESHGSLLSKIRDSSLVDCETLVGECSLPRHDQGIYFFKLSSSNLEDNVITRASLYFDKSFKITIKTKTPDAQDIIQHFSSKGMTSVYYKEKWSFKFSNGRILDNDYDTIVSELPRVISE